MEWTHRLGILFSNDKTKFVFIYIYENVVEGPTGDICKIKPLIPKNGFVGSHK